MATESGLTLLSLPAAPAAPGPGSGLLRASTPASAPAGPESAARAAAAADRSGSQQAQSSSAQGSGQNDQSRPARSEPSGSKASAKGRAGKPGGSNGESRSARRAGGASSASSTKPAPGAAAASDGFSAALARSLAATPADQAAPAHGGPARAVCGAGTKEAGAQPGKHSAADPAATALILLEHALAGALLGAPAAAAPTSAAPAAAGPPALGGQSTSGAKATAAAIATELALTLGPDAKGAAATSSPASSPGAGTGAPAAAAAAALTAAPAAAGSHVGLPQLKPDSLPMTLSSPVGSGAWTDELGTRLSWMAHQGIESASLHLSPDHLGPLQVSISVHNGQASVWFGAAQPDTRAALQQSLPQLRQLFANQGLTLADAGVSRESPRGQGRQGSGRAVAATSAVAAVDVDSAGGRAVTAGGLGLVDTYA